MQKAIYYLAISVLVAHELDAMTHSEWRLLFGFRDLEDLVASKLFVAGHVPLLFVVLWFSHHVNPKIADWTKTGVSAFLVVHTLMHFALSGVPEYDFNGLLSRSLIFASGALAGVVLLSRWRGRESNPPT